MESARTSPLAGKPERADDTVSKLRFPYLNARLPVLVLVKRSRAAASRYEAIASFLDAKEAIAY